MITLGFRRGVLCFAAAAMLAGCGAPRGVLLAPAASAGRSGRAFPDKPGKIQHVVIIIQENRTVDNLFNGFPGADTAQFGTNSKGQQIQLLPEPLTAPYDITHSHSSFLTEYNHGSMNGFDRTGTHCRGSSHCPPPGLRAYGYVPRYDDRPYFDMGKKYTFADETFQTNQGPSFPAHQYLVSGTSTNYDGSPLRASENPGHHRGGCDSPSGTVVPLINARGFERDKGFPCFDRISIFTLLDDAGIGWKFYQANSGARVWNAVDALKPIWENRTEYAQNVIVPSSRVLTDISNKKLAQVVVVTPTAAASDHSGATDGTGPDWVASVVDAIGESAYWKSTAIFVTWDDWGGWYDHATPTIYNSYELGFRVPLIVISPYAKKGYVSHVPHEFGSILKFTEEAFGLPSLGTTDLRSDDLSDCFDFGERGRGFESIRTRLSAQYFLRQSMTNEVPDPD